jgi:hypothetical protein
MRASNVVGLYLHSNVDLISIQEHRAIEPDMPLTRPLHIQTYNKTQSFAYLHDTPILLVFSFHFTRKELWNSLTKSKMSPLSQFFYKRSQHVSGATQEKTTLR